MMPYARIQNGLRLASALVLMIGAMSPTAAIVQADQGFSTVDSSDFSYPVAWLKTGPARQRMEYSFRRNRMLKMGFENVTAEGLTSARQEYEIARQICADDPRLDYGFGLVLWTQGQRNSAISQFETAARLNGSTPFIPAIQAAAWGCLATDQDERGLKLLTTLAGVISKSHVESLSESQRKDAALILGRAFGYLDGPGRSDQRDPETLRAATEAFAALPANLKKDFELGKAQVATRQAEIKALAAQPMDQLKAEFNTVRTQLQADVAATNQSFQKTSQEMAKSQRERRKTSGESTAKLNTIALQMENVQFRGSLVSQVAARLSVPQAHVGVVDVGPTYISSDNDSKSSARHSSGKDTRAIQTHVPMLQTYLRPENSCEQMARLGQFRQAMAEMQQIETQATRLRREAQDVQAKRKTAMEQNTQAAQVLSGELKDTRRSARELAQQLQNLERNHRSQTAMKANADSLLAYVPWDLELDREALTKSYLLSAK